LRLSLASVSWIFFQVWFGRDAALRALLKNGCHTNPGCYSWLLPQVPPPRVPPIQCLSQLWIFWAGRGRRSDVLAAAPTGAVCLRGYRFLCMLVGDSLRWSSRGLPSLLRWHNRTRYRSIFFSCTRQVDNWPSSFFNETLTLSISIRVKHVSAPLVCWLNKRHVDADVVARVLSLCRHIAARCWDTRLFCGCMTALGLVLRGHTSGRLST
jgi:hypothetical protein